MLPTSTTPIERRLSLRFMSSQIWKPNMRGSAAESTATRGSLRWISSIASTPSLTTTASMPQECSASSRSLPASASGIPTSTRSAPGAGAALAGRAGAARTEVSASDATGAAGASAWAASASSAGGRTRKTASHLAQRSRTPSGRSFSFSIR